LRGLKEGEIERKPKKNEGNPNSSLPAERSNLTDGFVHRGNSARGTGFGLVGGDKENGMVRLPVIDFQTFTALAGFVSSEI
jgi:hypothetical protein